MNRAAKKEVERPRASPWGIDEIFCSRVCSFFIFYILLCGFSAATLEGAKVEMTAERA